MSGKTSLVTVVDMMQRDHLPKLTGLSSSNGVVAWCGDSLEETTTSTVKILYPGQTEPIALNIGGDVYVNDMALHHQKGTGQVQVTVVSPDWMENDVYIIPVDSDRYIRRDFLQLHDAVKPNPNVQTVTRSPNGEWTAVTGTNGRGAFVALADNQTHRPEYLHFYEHSHYSRHPLVALSNSWWAIADDNGVRFVSLLTNASPHKLSLSTPITILELSSDNGLAVVSDGNLWIGKTIHTCQQIDLPKGTVVRALTFTPDGEHCFVATDGGASSSVNPELFIRHPQYEHPMIRVISVTSGEEVGSVRVPGGSLVNHLAATDTQIFAGTDAGEILEWQIAGLNT